MIPSKSQCLRQLILIAIALIGAASPSPADPPPTASPSEMPWLIPYTDYRGDLWTRPALTGDWGGERQRLMDNGLRFDAYASFTLQGVAAGGIDNQLGTSSGLELTLQLDTGKAHLWPGGILKITGQGRFGPSANTSTGALMPVNTEALYPFPNRDTFLLPELNYTQFLAPWIGLTLGKYSPREANVFAHDETEQFLNTAFTFNPAASTTIPLSCLGAGLILLPTPDITILTLALDSEGTAETSGFDTVFRRGTTIMQNFELKVSPWGLSGHQRITWTYSDRNRIQFIQNPRQVLGTILTGNSGLLARRSTDWSVSYDFDQYLHMVPGSKDRGWGIFGRVGAADDQVNLAHWFYSIGLGAKGLFDSRPNDTCGIGLYYVRLTNNLPGPLDRRSQDEYGGEIYYNIALTPWLHVTPDLQIIEPATRHTDTTVVAGVRLRASF
jgi:porin